MRTVLVNKDYPSRLGYCCITQGEFGRAAQLRELIQITKMNTSQQKNSGSKRFFLCNRGAKRADEPIDSHLIIIVVDYRIP